VGTFLRHNVFVQDTVGQTTAHALGLFFFQQAG